MISERAARGQTGPSRLPDDLCDCNRPGAPRRSPMDRQNEPDQSQLPVLQHRCCQTRHARFREQSERRSETYCLCLHGEWPWNQHRKVRGRLPVEHGLGDRSALRYHVFWLPDEQTPESLPDRHPLQPNSHGTRRPFVWQAQSDPFDADNLFKDSISLSSKSRPATKSSNSTAADPCGFASAL